MTRRTTLSLVLGALSIAACDPSDPCDAGYYSDHFFCYRVDSGAQVEPDDDAGMLPPKNTIHGTPCAKQSDCGGTAPLCGAPQLPVCTSTDCFDAKNPCPTDWTCLDVTRYATDLAVSSVCVMLP